MTIEEICNKYIKVKATGILALHQRPKLDWAFKVVSGKESDVCNGCFLEKYYPLRLPYICAAQEREDGKNVQFKEIGKTMDREEVKKLLPIMRAFACGKTIQYEFNEGWRDLDEITPLGDISKYRIKPEPKCRPFKNQEECWQEMLKHQPFGWLKTKTDGRYSFIGEHFSFQELFTGVALNSSTVELEPCSSAAFDGYTFADGTPFGMVEEE